MKPYGLYEGDRSEFLAMFALSTIGHCIPVPRQSDQFSIDLFVHLLRKVRRNVVSTGKMIAVQVKSNAEEIFINRPEQISCIHHSAVPIFLAVVNKRRNELALYTTFLRFIAYWTNPSASVRLIPGRKDNRQFPHDGAIPIFLGQPIVRLRLNEIEEDATKVARRRMLSTVVEWWANWEQKHIGWMANNLPLLLVPGHYATNECFSVAHGDIDFLTFNNRSVLAKAESGLTKTLTGMRAYYEELILHAPGVAAEDAVLHERMHLLDAILAHMIEHD